MTGLPIWQPATIVIYNYYDFVCFFYILWQINSLSLHLSHRKRRRRATREDRRAEFGLLCAG